MDSYHLKCFIYMLQQSLRLKDFEPSAPLYEESPVFSQIGAKCWVGPPWGTPAVL